jgi:hypothetical protein
VGETEHFKLSGRLFRGRGGGNHAPGPTAALANSSGRCGVSLRRGVHIVGPGEGYPLEIASTR